jgi:hypothetical protein
MVSAFLCPSNNRDVAASNFSTSSTRDARLLAIKEIQPQQVS